MKLAEPWSSMVEFAAGVVEDRDLQRCLGDADDAGGGGTALIGLEILE